jgi:S-adenosyl-L-methionine methyltransferase
MSRLDSMIRRLTTQRLCLDWAAPLVAALPGPILEFGLGNGRTYDHLRQILPNRDIFVFDRQVGAHPDCIPPQDHLILGEFRVTAKACIDRFNGNAALIHADVGSGDAMASRALAKELCPSWVLMLRADGLLLSDQPLHNEALLEMAPPQVTPGRYFIFKRRTLASG